jgi:RHS repeat-associated protein
MVNAANNQFTELVYDAAGNVTKDKVIGTGRMEYKYDAENHVVAAGNNFVTNNTAPTSQYFYDANGKRTRKLVSGVETWFVYGIDGELVAEYNANAAVASPQKEYGYRGGQLLVVYDNTEPLADKKLQWMVADHLGTPRMVIDKTGSLSGIKRHDYLPFGEEIGANVGIRSAGNGYTADQIKQKFTGKRRDDETGLDFFEARYFSSTQGRFTSPDEFTGGATELFAVVTAHNPTFYAELAEPQSLNKYTYCLNNPYKFVDPDGHQSTIADGMNAAGQALQSQPNPYAQAAAKVFFIAGAAAYTVANTDWGQVKKDVLKATESLEVVPCGEGWCGKQDFPHLMNKSAEQGSNTPKQQSGQNGNQSQPANSGKKPSDSSKNEKHGDDGRAKAKAEKSVAELNARITPGMSRKERIQIENKIKKINLAADRADKGTEDGRRGR